MILPKALLRINKTMDNFDFFVLNVTFSNISAILWRPLLVVEKAEVPGENHRPRASNWQTLFEFEHWVRCSVYRLCLFVCL
jgi:hypothetical protein